MSRASLLHNRNPILGKTVYILKEGPARDVLCLVWFSTFRIHPYPYMQDYSPAVPCLNTTLQWRHNGRDRVSNHQHHDCLLNDLFRRRSKKTSKLRVTGLCAGNSRVPGEFPAQMASNAENVSIWWRHHEDCLPKYGDFHYRNNENLNNGYSYIGKTTSLYWDGPLHYTIKYLLGALINVFWAPLEVISSTLLFPTVITCNAITLPHSPQCTPFIDMV